MRIPLLCVAAARYSLLMRRATSFLSHFHRSMTRGFVHSKKTLPHFHARRPAVFVNATARSNQGNNGLFRGIFARTQSTQSRTICEIERHKTPHGCSTVACSIALRNRANSAAISVLLRRSSSSWRESSLACAASCSARRSMSSAFSGVALLIQQAIVDFSNLLVDLKRDGLILEKHFVALLSHIAQEREILCAPVFRAQRRRRPWE